MAPHPETAAGDARTRPSRRRSFIVGLAAAFAVLVLGALPGAAQTRDFTGVVENAGANSLTVGNRMGDSVRFTKVDGTKVTGKRSSWGAIEKGDPRDGLLEGWAQGLGGARARHGALTRALQPASFVG